MKKSNTFLPLKGKKINVLKKNIILTPEQLVDLTIKSIIVNKEKLQK